MLNAARILVQLFWTLYVLIFTFAFCGLIVVLPDSRGIEWFDAALMLFQIAIATVALYQIWTSPKGWIWLGWPLGSRYVGEIWEVVWGLFGVAVMAAFLTFAVISIRKQAHAPAAGSFVVQDAFDRLAPAA